MDQLLQLNRRYDGWPELWRFPAVIAALVVVGAINMALTISGPFPFALLVLLAIVAIIAIRVPYVLGWGHTHTGEVAAAGEMEAAGDAPATKALAPAGPSVAEAAVEPPRPSYVSVPPRQAQRPDEPPPAA